MKKFYSFLIAAIIMLAFPMGMMGQTTHTIGWGTASGDAGTYTNFTATSGTVTNILSFSTAQNGASNAPAYNANSKELRLYSTSNGNGCSITITPVSDLTITQIVITATSGYTSDVKYSVDGGTATAATWSSNTCTISGIEANTSLMVQNVKTGTQQLRIKTIAVTYAVDGPVTYTVTYDCNGGTSGCPENLTGLSANTSITLANAPTKEHFNFEGWSDGTNTYDAGDSYTVNSHVTFTAQWESDGTVGEGSICFSSQSSCTAINSQSVTGEDNLGNTWTITTAGTSSFTANSGYYQVGSGNSPASSITFTTTLDEEVNVTDFSAMFGGFNATRASVVLKVDDTQVGSGTLNGSADVTVSSSSPQIGTTLTVIVTPTAGGVKCYNISYAYETITPSQAVNTTTTINVPANFNKDIYQGTTAGTLTATVSAEGTPISEATVTWSSSNTDVATIDNNGEVTLVAVGTTIITASYAGVEDVYRPSSATYELTVTNSNAPGTVNNPYTVAQARAAIDANTGITGVYATGIVSAIPSAWSTQYNNITFNFVDEEGDNNFLQAYRCASGDNVDASEVAVGDVVVVYGNLTKYGSTYEFGQGCQLVALTHPAVAVEAPTFSPAAGTYASAQSVTISCELPSTVIYYTLDGTEPTPNSTLYSEAISVSSTTTIKAVAYAGGDDHSTVATANYYFCSDEDPYTVTEALAFAEYQYPANGIYVSGIVSTAPTAAPTNSGQLTYYISVDGEAENQLEIYKGLGLNEAAFTAQNDIQVGDIVTVYGNVVIYGTSNPIKEFAQGNYLVSFERPEPVLEEYDLTVSTLNDHINAIYVFNIDEPNDPLIEEGQAGTIQVLEGTGIMVSPDVEEGYVLASLTVLDSEGTSVQPEDHMSDGGYYSFTMPSGPVTITATAMEAPATVDYELYSGALVEGDYIIYYNGYAMNHTVTSGRLQYETVTPNNNVITTYSAEIVWHIAPSATEGYWTIYSDDAQAYAAGTGVKNKAQMLAELNDDNNDMALWSVTVAESKDNTYEFVNKYNYANNVNHLLRNNGTNGFACYASQTGGALSLYKKVEASTETYDLTINGYGDNDQVTNGWYLIASPVATTPDQVENMRSNTYDLYRFNSTAIGAEWENYKNEEHNGFSIVPGQGYLYANSGTVTLKFSGDLYYGDGIITLENAGWNLVGNPYYEMTTNIERAFYRMNSTNDGLIAGTANDNVNAWEGIFVEAAEAGETVTFAPVTGAKSSSNASVVMNLSSNSNVIDRAIVNFAEGRQLSKFQLFDNSTKLCIVENGKEFAIANAEAQGEMPVNFKAATNGTYTISINTENVEMNYLHLIDNMTGDDVDLLATPSYTFNATTTDYASRFKLVFSTNDTDSDDFAFISDGSIILNGQGNVQVFDITGRMISSHNDVNSITTNGMAAGVYMLRLVNGSDVKTQKIVVR